MITILSITLPDAFVYALYACAAVVFILAAYAASIVYHAWNELESLEDAR
jgi:hypothetical protein